MMKVWVLFIYFHFVLFQLETTHDPIADLIK